MKILVIVLSFVFAAACSSVKTRKQAAEEAKAKAEAEAAAENYTPAEDAQVINDELAKMGIDPDHVSKETPPTDSPAPKKKKSTKKK